MNALKRIHHPGRWLLLAMLLVTTAVYWPGLSGGWLFDDYPNIVDNKGVQPDRASVGELVGAALSSPSSRFKRPLSSLSFAANYLADGLDPWGWKLVNLVIHLLNGLLVFVLARGLLVCRGRGPGTGVPGPGIFSPRHPGAERSEEPGIHFFSVFARAWRRGHKSKMDPGFRPAAGPRMTGRGDPGVRPRIKSGAGAAAGSGMAKGKDDGARRAGIVAALVAGGWMLLPINLTGVLYVVQRMESLANLFVLLGLVGYVAGRRRMLTGRRGPGVCIASLMACTAIGLTAKETAVMLPLYAFLIEWIVFGFRDTRRGTRDDPVGSNKDGLTPGRRPGLLASLGPGTKKIVGALASRLSRRSVRNDVVSRHSGAAESGTRNPPAAAMRREPDSGYVDSGSSRRSVRKDDEGEFGKAANDRVQRDRRIVGLFVVVLVLPMLGGLAWVVPHVLDPASWATRDFTLDTRLLSEARIVAGYIAWTLVPLPHWLSFYHDNFQVSAGLLSPWTTLASLVAIVALVVAVFGLRRRRPLVALGIALFLGCHLLTGTILPLELIYEHRNYFASFGLLLALVPLLAAPGRAVMADARGRRHAALDEDSSGDGTDDRQSGAERRQEPGTAPPRHPGAGRRPEPGMTEWEDPGVRPRIKSGTGSGVGPGMTEWEGPAVRATHDPGMPKPGGTVEPGGLPFPLARWTLLGALGIWWIALTLATSSAWGDPLHLAQELAARAPDSPRAQYELGRTYIIYSNYDPDSPFTPLVYAPLEQAAKLPDASILPEQALIFFNARMHRPLKDAWWDSLITKLKAHPPGVQDVSSIGALTKCARGGSCKLPTNRMVAMFHAAMAHPDTPARLMTMYGDYAWNVLGDHALGLRMAENTVAADPDEPVYHITLARMYLVLGQPDEARGQIRELQRLNYGGRLDGSIANLKARMTTSD